MIILYVILGIAYFVVGLFTSATFTGCFGIPNPRGVKEILKAMGIQLMLIFLWPLFLLWVFLAF